VQQARELRVCPRFRCFAPQYDPGLLSYSWHMVASNCRSNWPRRLWLASDVHSRKPPTTKAVRE